MTSNLFPVETGLDWTILSRYTVTTIQTAQSTLAMAGGKNTLNLQIYVMTASVGYVNNQIHNQLCQVAEFALIGRVCDLINIDKNPFNVNSSG